MTRDRELAALSRLARLNGLQTSFFNVDAQRVQAGPESLLAILKAIGVPLASPADVPETMREQETQAWHYQTEPVLIAWDGRPAPLPLRMPSGARGRLQCSLRLEEGTSREWAASLEDVPVALETAAALERHLQLQDVPLGYHRLHLHGAGFDAETLVIAAPTRAYEAPGPKQWGVFLPLYGLRTQDSWGAGDYSDLAALADWLQARGGDIVATLPLGPTFLDDLAYSPSPYSPVSRLMWNEFYVDPRRAPGADAALLNAPDVLREIEALRSAPEVDYQAGMALKRRLLGTMASTPAGRAAVAQKAAADEDVAEYARFRAAMGGIL